MRPRILALLLVLPVPGVLPVLGGGAPALAETPPAEALVGLRAAHERPLERRRSSVLSLSLVLGAGLRLLEEGPLFIELEGTAIDPTRRSLRRRDAIDPRAELPRFEIEVRPHPEGTPTLNARLTAWVCRETRCRPVEQRVAIPLDLVASVPAHGAQPSTH